MTSRVRWAAAIVVLAVTGALVAPAGASTPRAKQPAYEETIHLTVDDLQDYWATELPALYGVRYKKIPAAKIIPYTSTSKIPRCGPGPVRYKDVAQNAFYCNAGKFLAYDDENLFPQLAHEFGDFVVLLHRRWLVLTRDAFQRGLGLRAVLGRRRFAVAP